MSIDSPEGIASYCKNEYSYWRRRIMLSMIIGYAFFYIIRQSYPAIIHPLELEFGFTKTQIGAILGIGGILYGVGKSFAGMVGDRFSARYLMTFGLFMSGVTTFYFAKASDLKTFTIIYTVNMCFQSLGWPSCARLLTHWFSAKELATKWALWNSSQQIGGAAIMVLSGFILVRYDWRFVLYLSAFLSCFMSVILFFMMRDTPESLGLPSIEHHHGLKALDNDDDRSIFDLLIYKVLANKLVWYMCFANFFVYIARMSIFVWGPTMLQEVKGSSIHQAMNLTAAYDIAGILGGIVAGYLSDKVFNGYRGRVGAFFMLGITISVLFLWMSPSGSTFFHLVAMVLIGFMVTGPQILVGVAAVDFSSKKTAGLATGLTGTIGYIGHATATAGVGFIAQHYGWDYTFAFMIVSGILGAFFFALTWNQRSKTLED
ncbi:MAG: Glycerol-3-phosphate transporter [Holosporales bacterium]